jgi:hypothetical protein
MVGVVMVGVVMVGVVMVGVVMVGADGRRCCWCLVGGAMTELSVPEPAGARAA